MIEVATWGFGGTGEGIAVWGWLDEVTTATPIYNINQVSWKYIFHV